jgi:hypothetical protein
MLKIQYMRLIKFIILLFYLFSYSIVNSQTFFQNSYQYINPVTQSSSIISDLIKTNDGGSMVALSKNNSGLFANFIKLDTIGNVQWVFNPAGIPNGVIQMADSSIITISSDYYIIYITSLNQFGVINWMKYIIDTTYNALTCLKWNDSTLMLNSYSHFIWLSGKGDIVRQFRHQSESSSGIWGDNASIIRKLNEEVFYVTGNENGSHRLMAYDTIGNFLWGRKYLIYDSLSGDTFALSPYQFKINLSGEIILTGQTTPIHSTYYTYILCTDTLGNLKWKYLLDNVDACDILIMPDNSIRLLGISYHSSAIPAFIMKFDPDSINHRIKFFPVQLVQGNRPVRSYFDNNVITLARTGIHNYFEFIQTDADIQSYCGDHISSIPSYNINSIDYPLSDQLTISNLNIHDTLFQVSNNFNKISHCISTSSEEVYENDFVILPIPAQNILRIQSGKFKLFNWEILSIQGKRELQGKNDFNEIDISKLKSGFYFLRINANEKLTTVKILKE